MKKKQFFTTTLLAGLFAIGSPLLANAAEKSSAEATKTESKSPRHHMKKNQHMKQHYKKFGFFVPGYGPVSQELIDELELSDKQKDKIKKLKEKMQEQRQAMHGKNQAENRKKMFEMRKEQLESKKLDPKKMLELQEKHQDAMRDKREDFQKDRAKWNKEWLSFWEDLNKEQQEKVAEYFKDNQKHRGHGFNKHRQSK